MNVRRSLLLLFIDSDDEEDAADLQEADASVVEKPWAKLAEQAARMAIAATLKEVMVYVVFLRPK